MSWKVLNVLKNDLFSPLAVPLELELRLKTPQACFHAWVSAAWYRVSQEGLGQFSLYLNQTSCKVNTANLCILCSDILIQ